MISKRELKIISFLLDRNHHVTGDEISSFIGVSPKTIRADIRNINGKLQDINAVIMCVKGRGYILQISDRNLFDKHLLKLYDENINIDTFIPTTHEGRVIYIIKKLLLLELKYNRGITQRELCDNLYISLTTLKTDLIAVKKKLKKFGIEVLRDGIKGIALKGNEEKVRSCISYYIFQRYENDIINFNCIDPIFEREKVESVEDILTDLINEYHISITDISFYNLLIHILIAIKRVKTEKTLQKIIFEDELKDTYKYKVAKELAERININNNIKLPEEEIYFMTQHLCTRKIIEEDNQNKLKLDEYYTSLVLSSLNEIDNIIGVDFRNDSSLIWSLATHLKSAITRIKYSMHITNSMLSDIKRNYSFAYKIASISAQYIEKEINKEVIDEEIGFICLHFAAALERIKNRKGKEKVRALIVCASGLGTSMIMSAKIKSEFSNSLDIVKIIPLNELKQVNKNSYDIIISTIKINFDEYDLEEKKVVYISPILKTKDISSLKEFISENKEDYLLKFLEFTDEELFYTNMNLKSKEEILDFMLDKMVDKKFLKEGEKEYFYKRENISSTEIGNLIAIPHAIDINPDVSKVCIFINKRAIQWEEEKVRLVILMSIEKELYLEFGEILENLYNVLSDKEKVSKILNVENYKEFIKLLR